MRVPRRATGDALLPPATGLGAKPGPDAGDRRAAPGLSPVWVAQLRLLAHQGGLAGQPQAGAALDAEDGHGGAGPQAARALQAASRPSGLSVFAPGPRGDASEPGLERRHHLCSDPRRLRLPGCDPRLVQPQGPRLGALQHTRCRLLCKGPSPGAQPVLQSRDLQHRPRQPVHKRRVARHLQGPANSHLNGCRGRAIDNFFIERLWRTVKYD